MGVQTYDGREHRYVDYAIAEVLQMMGRACRPTVDSSSRCVLMLQQTRKEFFTKFLAEALPVESMLPGNLWDHFNAEIVARTIENKQDAVDWCTWTWVSLFRELVAHPSAVLRFCCLVLPSNDAKSRSKSHPILRALKSYLTTPCTSSTICKERVIVTCLIISVN
jgi:replicative superfamily II helicase